MFKHFCLLSLFLCVVGFPFGISVALQENRSPANEDPKSARVSAFFDIARRRCPLCDSSVFGYCNEKLFHDSCCCNNPNNPYSIDVWGAGITYTLPEDIFIPTIFNSVANSQYLQYFMDFLHQ